MFRSCDVKNCTLGIGRPKICVPIVGSAENEILSQAAEIQKASLDSTIDVVEFRGDFFHALSDFAKLKSVLLRVGELLPRKVLLFTVRSEREGGQPRPADSPAIGEINRFVIEEHLADLVDVELFSKEAAVSEQIALAHEHGVKVILSNHDFHATPPEEEIVNRLCDMQRLGADIAKIAVMPKDSQDVLRLLSATVTMKEQYAEIPIVTMSMGKDGVISRVSGELFGSAMTFGCLGEASAPGQIPVADLNHVMDTLCNRN